MDTRFLLHNIHRQEPERFQVFDPHLSKLKQYKYVYTPALLQQLPIAPGLYTLTSGSLTGKTTLLKLWIEKLLADGVPREAISFFPGDLIKDDKDLIHLLQTQSKNKPSDIIAYVLIDDITHIRGWEKGIKFAVDNGLLDHAIIMLTSSDKTISDKIHFPNQQAKKTNFHLYPLTFHESVVLKYPHSQVDDIDLFKEFNHYLLHGGYLIAMNDIAIHGKMLDETLITYANSLQNDMLRLGKQEHFLREILTVIIKHYCRPITWNMLSKELSIDHPKTIGDYISLLESLDALFIQPALLEDKLKAAPKKARKLMFTDSFIFHAVKEWLRHSNKNIVASEMLQSLNEKELTSQLVKSCAITHYRRHYPTYYIKGEGEIDLAYLYEHHFWPVVVTWANLLRPKDLKQILKYPHGEILTKDLRSGIVNHITTEPLPLALWKFK